MAGASSAMSSQIAVTYACMVLWIVLSAVVIMANKWILDPHMGGFPYPVALTCAHMAFCYAFSWALVRLRVTDVQPMARDMWLRSVVPIGGLFGITLWLGNAAYLYLSVSFIQMLKACMPIAVYSVGCVFGTETLSSRTAANMALIVGGVIIASHGELLFVWGGVIRQMASVASEAVRLTLVQILLQSKGVSLNPISTMYYVAPVCFVCLLIPFGVLEAPRMLQHGAGNVSVAMIVGSAALAFALNVSIFLLIGKSSALNMNVAGVVKDWLLIAASALMYKAPVTQQQLVGYGIAFLGVLYYNYQRIQAMKAKAASAEKERVSSPRISGVSSSGTAQAAARRESPWERWWQRSGGGGGNGGSGGGGGSERPTSPEQQHLVTKVKLAA